MIDQNDLLYKINRTPSFMAQVDWKEEPNGFDCKRMMYIIKGIKNDEVCNMVKDYIVTSWYEACNECFLCEKEDKSLFGSNGGWRFVPIEDGEVNEYQEPTIEDVIKNYMNWREKAIRRQTKKQTLDERAKDIEISLKLAKQSHEGLEPFVNDDLFANHYYNEYKRLLEENEHLRKQLEKREKENNALKHELTKVDIRDLVHEMIKYAEKFPPEQNERALAIKDVLNTKMVNKHIPLGVLDNSLLSRLNNLGLKSINHIDHYYESGSNHNDHSRHLNFNSGKNSNKLLE